MTTIDLPFAKTSESRQTTNLDKPCLRSVLVVADVFHYWKVVLLSTGEALMTAFDHQIQAQRWAESLNLRVL